ncbi:MAG: hypothetical protein PHE25_02260 [Candidatus Gracilibacteria bacterium]|nr:hypothetical protein [Candidatus Gracilibacteria bacterium]
MKKYFVLLFLSFFLVSCNKNETQPITETSKNITKEVSNSGNNIVVENNSISNTGEIKETKNEIIMKSENIEFKKVENIFETHLDSLVVSFSGSLLDKNTFNNFINNDSGGTSVGKLNDWINAFQTLCSNKNNNFPIYNWKFIDSKIILELKRYCSNNENYNELVKKVFDYIVGKNNYTLNDLNFNASSLKSNIDSSPNSPIEKLIATQIFYGFEVEKFISVGLYKNQIIIIFGSSQEPGLPYYKLLRIYVKNEDLYVKVTNLDVENILNVNYGDKFGSDLYQKTYDINNSYNITNGPIFSKKENELLKGDWIDAPSKINEKLNTILVQELTKLIE